MAIVIISCLFIKHAGFYIFSHLISHISLCPCVHNYLLCEFDYLGGHRTSRRTYAHPSIVRTLQLLTWWLVVHESLMNPIHLGMDPVHWNYLPKAYIIWKLCEVHKTKWITKLLLHQILHVKLFVHHNTDIMTHGAFRVILNMTVVV